METEYTASFIRDLRRLRNPALRRRVDRIMDDLERATDPGAVAGATRLRGPGQFYRIRVGDYRIGLSVEDNKAIVTRFLHRRDIYRSFP